MFEENRHEPQVCICVVYIRNLHLTLIFLQGSFRRHFESLNQKNTPIFTVIKPVVIPNDRLKPKRKTIVLIYSFFGIVITSIWVLIKNPLYDIISDIRSK